MKNIGISLLVGIIFLANAAYAADVNKIAVAVAEKTLSAQVSEVAARSPYFLLFDQDGKQLEAVENHYHATQRKAGLLIVPFLAQKGVRLVVAGKFGKNMVRAMKSQGMDYLEFKGSVDSALKEIQKTGKRP